MYIQIQSYDPDFFAENTLVFVDVDVAAKEAYSNTTTHLPLLDLNVQAIARESQVRFRGHRIGIEPANIGVSQRADNAIVPMQFFSADIVSEALPVDTITPLTWTPVDLDASASSQEQQSFYWTKNAIAIKVSIQTETARPTEVQAPKMVNHQIKSNMRRYVYQPKGQAVNTSVIDNTPAPVV